jgi:hypothetical protein
VGRNIDSPAQVLAGDGQAGNVIDRRPLTPCLIGDVVPAQDELPSVEIGRGVSHNGIFNDLQIDHRSIPENQQGSGLVDPAANQCPGHAQVEERQSKACQVIERQVITLGEAADKAIVPKRLQESRRIDSDQAHLIVGDRDALKAASCLEKPASQ